MSGPLQYLHAEDPTDTPAAGDVPVFGATGYVPTAGINGNVTAAGTLTSNQVVIGQGTKAIATLGSLGTTTTVLHGNAAGAPTFATVVEADITLVDTTTNNVTTSAHGFAPKGTAGTTQYWRQDWTLGTPSGAGNVSTTGSPASGNLVVFSGSTTITPLSLIIPPQGRLTLTTATPWMTSTVTAATTIYYTPAIGGFVPIYDGTLWTPVAFSELSQATTDTTKSPAAVGNNLNYDLFVWNDSGTLRCTRGPSWSTDTSRGTGAGTTELEYVTGILMNKVNITNGPNAQRGTYVGSVRSNGSAQIDMIFGGAGGAGGEGTILGIWNMYNRRFIALANFDNTNTWNYTTASFQLKNAGTSTELNKIKFIIGWPGDGISATNVAWSSNTTQLITAICGIGLNSTTAAATGSATGTGRSPATGNQFSIVATYSAAAPLGFNYVAPLELSSATGTATWYGDNNTTTNLSSFVAQTMF